MTDAHTYPAEVFWSKEDEGFIAVAPDLPGCSAWGENQAAAIAELQGAISAWIEAAKSAGNPVPPPSRPAEEEFSGKFVIRMPKQLHRELARSAKMEGVSLNHWACVLLASKNAVHATALHGECLDIFPSSRGAALHGVGSIASILSKNYKPLRTSEALSAGGLHGEWVMTNFVLENVAPTGVVLHSSRLATKGKRAHG